MKKILVFFILATSAFASDYCKNLLIELSGKEKIREVFIIIDQTTAFPKHIRQNAIVNIFALLKPKTTVNIFTFSEYTKGKNISLVDRYYFNAQLTKDQRYDMGRKKLKEFDQCFKSQHDGMRRKLASDILDNFKDDKQSSNKSEILYTLKKISKKAVKLSRAKQKIVILLSDMLENSTYTSFYGKELKNLNIDKHINIIKKNKLFGDFDNADIIVIGAGIVDKENYRDGKDFDNLELLWEEYFKKSNAKLINFTTELEYPLKEIY